MRVLQRWFVTFTHPPTSSALDLIILCYDWLALVLSTQRLDRSEVIHVAVATTANRDQIKGGACQKISGDKKRPFSFPKRGVTYMTA